MSANQEEPSFLREKFTVTLTYEEWRSIYAALTVTPALLPETLLECDLISASITSQIGDALMR